MYPSQASSYVALCKDLPDETHATEDHTAVTESGLPNSPPHQLHLKGAMILGV